MSSSLIDLRTNKPENVYVGATEIGFLTNEGAFNLSRDFAFVLGCAAANNGKIRAIKFLMYFLQSSLVTAKHIVDYLQANYHTIGSTED
jgi:ribosomal protein L7/L12